MEADWKDEIGIDPNDPLYDVKTQKIIEESLKQQKKPL